ncbi:ribonuclease E/G [Novosphingobium sp. TH158]|uniref:Rne/Rng family ribonuclease n=1 Tax=Novosphingobium sp. TH158 TaxID=2067455 RepID=UPI000C7AAC5F|nr:ribonuclease E/G [Novosphingobium sp. TH158]PLK25784.1 ribonuclease E/G [Novosphingobium sp. TH158]
MTTRMLIDARHQEETRVAVLKGNRIEEFDFESAEHKQIKGNIYLAKVTRVEPSLQAAFVDFGGNRHGFLAFSEIHPDYYQIPKEDRERLLAEEAAHAEEEAALRAKAEGEEDFVGDDELGETLADELAGTTHDHHHDDEFSGVMEVDTAEKDEVATIEDGHVENGFDHEGEEADEAGESEGEGEGGEDRRGRRGRRRQGGGNRGHAKEADELRAKRMALRRRYKIQDVIQRRQVLLVQVVKEERGNKGAALTTYLSLAGRYCVLMPNSSHGGGISRKISSAADRKRLKGIIAELDLPKSMGCIVRTAGLQRTKTEIKRDFDYLARLWDEIRETTLKSSAPAPIHSDSDLIKRAIRDIYNKEIEEVVVEGEQGYRAARDFMKLLMPSHAKRVKAYSDPVPLFQRYGAEDQLTAMFEPVVQLKSGGYLVINPTEALVSIDINSGRSTKEHGIEATALSTNLEAAREIARQLRLRDMAGLVVIDFIDMEYGSNVRKVEKAMKEALKNDRARIQVGRISSFGLMEMSRQRLRTGVLEASTRSCPHCDGTGLVRTASSAGLAALRLIEDEAAKGKGTIITLYASTEASIYLLNTKRADLHEIEQRYGVQVQVIPEGENEGAKMRVASSGPRPTSLPRFEPIIEPEDDDIVEEDFDDGEDEEEDREERGDDRDGRGRKRRRRRRGGKGRSRDGDREDDRADGEEAEADEGEEAGDEAEGGDETGEDGESPRKRRRRGRRRRGGRGRGEGEGADGESEAGAEGAEPKVAGDVAEPGAEASEEAPAEEPAPKKRTRRKKADVTAEAEAAAEAASSEEAPAAEPVAEEKPKRTRRKKAEPAPEAETAPAAEAPAEEPVVAEKPKRTRKKKAEPAPEAEAMAEPAPEAEPAAEAIAEASADAAVETAAEEENGPKRRGWWQRTFGE